MAKMPGGPTTTWSMLALEPGTRRSWLTPQPCWTRGSRRRATWRSPAAPRCHAWASGLGWNRSRQQTLAAPARLAATPGGRGRPATVASSRPPRPASAAAASRRGRVRAQAACSTARRRWYSAWAEAPGVPYACRRRRRGAGAARRLEARRMGRSVSGSSGICARIASMSSRVSGWMDRSGASSSSQGRGNRSRSLSGWGLLVMGPPSVVLAGGPLGTLPAKRGPLGVGTRRRRLLARGRHAEGLGVAGALGEALLAVDPLDGSRGALPVRPLRAPAQDGAKRALRVADPVGAAVLLDLGGGLPPHPLPPRALRHGAEGLTQVRRPVLLDRLVRQRAGGEASWRPAHAGRQARPRPAPAAGSLAGAPGRDPAGPRRAGRRAGPARRAARRWTAAAGRGCWRCPGPAAGCR